MTIEIPIQDNQYQIVKINCEKQYGKKLWQKIYQNVLNCSRVDLEKQLIFPEQITEIILDLDIILFSNTKRESLIYELTVPSKENILLTYARKLGKYLDLCENCINNG